MPRPELGVQYSYEAFSDRQRARPAESAEMKDQVGGSNVSSPNDFVAAYGGMTSGGKTGHASIGDADGGADREGLLVQAAVDQLLTDAQHAQPVLPGKNCGACGALDFVPPTVARAVEVADIGKPAEGFASGSSESNSAGHYLPCNQ